MEASPVAQQTRRGVGASEGWRAEVAFVFLLGALLPIQRYLPVGDKQVNFSAAALALLPAALLLRSRWLHSRGLGRWVFALWVTNLIAWVGSTSLLDPGTLMREAVKIATCYLFALVGYAVGVEARTERALVKGMIFSALPISVIAIQSFFTRYPPVFIPEGRVAGLFTDPNAYGTYLAILVTLVMSLRVDLVAIPVFTAAEIVTFSRTGLVGLALSLLLGAAHARFGRYAPLLVMGVAGAALVWGNLSTGHAVAYRVMEYEDSLEGRRALWERAYEVAATHPVIGIGRGNWEAVSESHTIPHNTVLSVAASTGLLGVTVFLVPLGVWLWQGLRLRASRRWAIVLLVNLICGLSISFDNFLPFWLCTGVLVAQITVATREDRARLAMRQAEAEAVLLPAGAGG